MRGGAGWWVTAQRKAGGGGDLGKQTTWDQNPPLTYRSVTLSKSPALSAPWG